MAKSDKLIKLKCSNCGKYFERSLRAINKNKNLSKAPCCSKSCSGTYGRKIGKTPNVLFSDNARFHEDIFPRKM